MEKLNAAQNQHHKLNVALNSLMRRGLLWKEGTVYLDPATILSM